MATGTLVTPVPASASPAPARVTFGPFTAAAPALEDRCKRTACRYGTGCYRRNAEHMERFVHPGDRNYRIGYVIFEGNAEPQFDSLWQVFQYHDPDESGHLSKEEFATAMQPCRLLAPGKVTTDLEEAWNDAGGPTHGYVNFRQFVSWTREKLCLEYPLGLEESQPSG
eukprot:CAMPEP_0180826128 /NCGR_PEP_ID=MMETSP1038_2-20121128/73363_1 /TAXON_ID=632150 /ORGANISM="Azadinium spinosum, Strain 3D9" /LENGTH=167 /DNA_ID=CAMNT_0022868685 /DNA_START=78 /DNA_END=578 /DNA_ORIENTATION=+